MIYQTPHHQFVASSLVTKLCQISPSVKIGCMLAQMESYVHTCKPGDVLKNQQENQRNLFYTDMHARGDRMVLGEDMGLWRTSNCEPPIKVNTPVTAKHTQNILN